MKQCNDHTKKKHLTTDLEPATLIISASNTAPITPTKTIMTNANSFATLFQSAVTDASLVTYTAEQLSAAFDSATLHQFPLVASKLKALTKAVLKDGLFFAPVVAIITETGERTLVSGRHREHVASDICANYGVTSTGKTVLKTPENEGALQPITFEMKVSEISVPDMNTAVMLIVAANGSRTMTAPEQLKCKMSMGAATPAAIAQNKFAVLLSAGIDEYNASLLPGYVPVNLSAVTALQIIKACTSNIKTLVFATDEQATEFIDSLVAHLSTAELPDNFARDYRATINEFLLEVVAVDYDTDGEEVDVTYAESVARSITKPAPKARAKSDKSNKDDIIAKLQAQLAALGVTSA